MNVSPGDKKVIICPVSIPRSALNSVLEFIGDGDLVSNFLKGSCRKTKEMVVTSVNSITLTKPFINKEIEVNKCECEKEMSRL